VQSALMIFAGAVALLFSSLSSTAVVLYVGWLLIISGVLRAIGLIDAHDVPHFSPAVALSPGFWRRRCAISIDLRFASSRAHHATRSTCNLACLWQGSALVTRSAEGMAPRAIALNR
jgi:short repeat uncharacterized protein DUF308